MILVRMVHRIFIALSRAVMNNDESDGTAPHPLVWSAGALPDGAGLCMLCAITAQLPGPGLMIGLWVLPTAVCGCVLVMWVAFLCGLHWPAAGAELGVGSVSYVEMLVLYELWAGERLVLEKAVHRLPYYRNFFSAKPTVSYTFYAAASTSL